MTDKIERLIFRMLLTGTLKVVSISSQRYEALMRRALRELIEVESDSYVIGEPNNDAVAAEQLRSPPPDVALMHPQMRAWTASQLLVSFKPTARARWPV